MIKNFPLRTILTVTTGRLLTKAKGKGDNGIGDLYEHMTGEAPCTHSLGRFAMECKPYLLSSFPELKQANLSELDKMRAKPNGVEQWLHRCITDWKMNATYDIGQIPATAHAVKNPIDELVEKIK